MKDGEQSARAYLGVLLVVVLLSAKPSPDQLVAHGVGRGLEEVMLGGYVPVLDDGVVQVPIEGALYRGHVLQLRDVAHGNLLLAIAGAGRAPRVDRSSRHGSFSLVRFAVWDRQMALCSAGNDPSSSPYGPVSARAAASGRLHVRLFLRMRRKKQLLSNAMAEAAADLPSAHSAGSKKESRIPVRLHKAKSSTSEANKPATHLPTKTLPKNHENQLASSSCLPRGSPPKTSQASCRKKLGGASTGASSKENIPPAPTSTKRPLKPRRLAFWAF